MKVQGRYEVGSLKVLCFYHPYQVQVRLRWETTQVSGAGKTPSLCTHDLNPHHAGEAHLDERQAAKAAAGSRGGEAGVSAPPSDPMPGDKSKRDEYKAYLEEHKGMTMDGGPECPLCGGGRSDVQVQGLQRHGYIAGLHYGRIEGILTSCVSFSRASPS